MMIGINKIMEIKLLIFFLFVVHEDAWTVLKLSSFDLFRMSWVGCVNNFKDVPYYPCRGKNYRHQRSFIAVKFMHKSDIIVSRKKVNSFRESHVCYQDPQFHDSTWLKCVTKITFFFLQFHFYLYVLFLYAAFSTEIEYFSHFFLLLLLPSDRKEVRYSFL